MLLLIVRNSLKLPISKINYEHRIDIIDSRREFNWLKNKVSKKDIIEISKKKVWVKHYRKYWKDL